MDISQNNFQIWEIFIKLNANSEDPDQPAPFLALKVRPNVYANNEALGWQEHNIYSTLIQCCLTS